MAHLYEPKALPPQLDHVFNLMARLPLSHVFCVGGAPRDADNGFPIRDYDIFGTPTEGLAAVEFDLRKILWNEVTNDPQEGRFAFKYAGVTVDLAVFDTPIHIDPLLEAAPVAISAIAIEMNPRRVWVRHDYEPNCKEQVIRLYEAWDDKIGRAYAEKLHVKTGWEVRGSRGRLITPRAER